MPTLTRADPPAPARSLLAFAGAASARKALVASCTGAAAGAPCDLADGVVGTCDGGGFCGGTVTYTDESAAPAPAPGPFPACANVTCGVCLTCDPEGECVRAPDDAVCARIGGRTGVCKAGECKHDTNTGLAVGDATPDFPDYGSPDVTPSPGVNPAPAVW